MKNKFTVLVTCLQTAHIKFNRLTCISGCNGEEQGLKKSLLFTWRNQMCCLAPNTAEDSLWTKNGGPDNFPCFFLINKFIKCLREKLQEKHSGNWEEWLNIPPYVWNNGHEHVIRSSIWARIRWAVATGFDFNLCVDIKYGTLCHHIRPSSSMDNWQKSHTHVAFLFFLSMSAQVFLHLCILCVVIDLSKHSR